MVIRAFQKIPTFSNQLGGLDPGSKCEKRDSWILSEFFDEWKPLEYAPVVFAPSSLSPIYSEIWSTSNVDILYTVGKEISCWLKVSLKPILQNEVWKSYEPQTKDRNTQILRFY